MLRLPHKISMKMMVYTTLITSAIFIGANKVLASSIVQDPNSAVITEYWNDGRMIHHKEQNDRVQRTLRGGPEPTNNSELRPVKVHPLVADWRENLQGNELVDIIVTTKLSVPIPRLPVYDMTITRGSSIDPAIADQTDALISLIRQQRAELNRPLIRQLQELGGKSFRQYWIAPSVRVSLPVQAIDALVGHPEILSIDPVQGDEPPPISDADALDNNDVEDARALIQSDPYFNQDLTNGRIALIDTGVFKDHMLLSNPQSQIDVWKDCTDNSVDCSGPEPGDNCWSHGTRSAAIISGTDSLGSEFRGVTNILIDSYKVYPDDDGNGNCGSLNYDATVNAFQEAITTGARVIVAEVQSNTDEWSVISLAADGAYDAGAVVVAAVGNYGGGPTYGTVRSPAIAHKVIGVGAYWTTTLAEYSDQSRGPATDGRIKPDIQMPTGAETAIPVSDEWFIPPEEALEPYGSTSGAVPFAGGAAALLRNWLERTRYDQPGFIYANLIMAGQYEWPFNNDSGAGPSILPVNGITWRSEVTIRHNELVEISIEIDAETATDLEVGLWWPEHDIHNNIDMGIMSPAGIVEEGSNSGFSVFEGARVEGPIETGTWKIQLLGANVIGEQTVYVSARVANVISVCSGSLLESTFTPPILPLQPLQPHFPLAPWQPLPQIWSHTVLYSVDCPD